MCSLRDLYLWSPDFMRPPSKKSPNTRMQKFHNVPPFPPVALYNKSLPPQVLPSSYDKTFLIMNNPLPPSVVSKTQMTDGLPSSVQSTHPGMPSRPCVVAPVTIIVFSHVLPQSRDVFIRMS